MGVSSSCGFLRASSSLSWCQDARWPGSGQPEVTPTTSSTSTVSTTQKRVKTGATGTPGQKQCVVASPFSFRISLETDP